MEKMSQVVIHGLPSFTPFLSSFYILLWYKWWASIDTLLTKVHFLYYFLYLVSSSPFPQMPSELYLPLHYYT